MSWPGNAAEPNARARQRRTVRAPEPEVVVRRVQARGEEVERSLVVDAASSRISSAGRVERGRARRRSVRLPEVRNARRSTSTAPTARQLRVPPARRRRSEAGDLAGPCGGAVGEPELGLVWNRHRLEIDAVRSGGRESPPSADVAGKSPGLDRSLDGAVGPPDLAGRRRSRGRSGTGTMTALALQMGQVRTCPGTCRPSARGLRSGRRPRPERRAGRPPEPASPGLVPGRGPARSAAGLRRARARPQAD